MNLGVAMLSVHTCPLAALGGKETGGMNVYVRELARELGRMGVEVDVFTRSQNPAIPRVVELGERARSRAAVDRDRREHGQPPEPIGGHAAEVDHPVVVNPDVHLFELRVANQPCLRTQRGEKDLRADAVDDQAKLAVVR